MPGRCTDVSAILDFWFGNSDPAVPVQARTALWFGAAPDTDQSVRDRFGALHQALCQGQVADMVRTPAGRLAFIICVDQFSRNLYRGDKRAFAADRRALDAAIIGVEGGVQRSFGLHQRAFFYLPFEHAEDDRMQSVSVALYTKLVEGAAAEDRPAAERYLRFAVQHQRVIDEFGRFPGRNAALGRTTTRDEFSYLRQPAAGPVGFAGDSGSA
ncbi:MAG: DUF924 domain-containing protein [Oligoflexia bacterium]|nr:DUF924 domain-containing protein [Oligoflexia bacterium]